MLTEQKPTSHKDSTNKTGNSYYSHLKSGEEHLWWKYMTCWCKPWVSIDISTTGTSNSFTYYTHFTWEKKEIFTLTKKMGLVLSALTDEPYIICKALCSYREEMIRRTGFDKCFPSDMAILHFCSQSCPFSLVNSTYCEIITGKLAHTFVLLIWDRLCFRLSA